MFEGWEASLGFHFHTTKLHKTVLSVSKCILSEWKLGRELREGKLEQASLGLYFIQQKLTNLLYELQDNKIQHANIWEGNDRGKW